MLFAFQPTDEDVKTVVEQIFCQECSFERAEALLEKLDKKKIAEAALHGDDLEKQAEYAQEEIAVQLKSLFDSETPAS